jgi:hypothetical protein
MAAGCPRQDQTLDTEKDQQAVEGMATPTGAEVRHEQQL